MTSQQNSVNQLKTLTNHSTNSLLSSQSIDANMSKEPLPDISFSSDTEIEDGSIFFDITKDDDGNINAVHPSLVMTLVPNGDPDAKIFNRNAIKKNVRTGKTVKQIMLVGQLNGVRVYYKNGHIIMTTEDLYL